MFLLRTDDLPKQLTAQTTSLDLARGDTLCRRGDPVRSLFALEYGRLRSWIVTTEGKHVPLYTVRSGECVLEEALFQDYHCSDVVAEIRSRVRSFPATAVKATLRQRPDLAAEFMALQGKRFSALSHSLELRSLRSAQSRIMEFIGRTSAAAGSNGVRLDQTLKNIADDLGLSHEVFYRTLARLIEKGLVRRTKHSIALGELFLASDDGSYIMDLSARKAASLSLGRRPAQTADGGPIATNNSRSCASSPKCARDRRNTERVGAP